MKVAVNQTSYVNGRVGIFEIADDATPEQIEAALNDFIQKNGSSGLCHHCSDDLGDLSDTSYTASNEAGDVLYDDSYSGGLQRWRDEVLAAMGLPLSAADHLPAILRAIRKTEIRANARLHLKSGRLYIESHRQKAWKNFKVDARFGKSDWMGPLVTDPIKRGEEVVVYQDAETDLTYARPASMFDDGRFLPL